MSTIYFTGKSTLIGETLNKLYYGTPKFTPVFRGVREAPSLVFCVVFARSWFVQLSFFFWQLFICPSSFYRFWLPLWYLPLFLSINTCTYGTWSSTQQDGISLPLPLQLTHSQIRDTFYWSVMTKDIDNWIQHCGRCLKRKKEHNRKSPININSFQPT